MLWSKWTPGASVGATGQLLVSVTDFTANRFRDLPRAAAAGFTLGGGWKDTDGAVGMWLWFMPTQRRCGSLSIWTGNEALRRFVGSSEHMVIVRAYRNRGTMNSDSWGVESTLPRQKIREAAEDRLHAWRHG